MAAGCLTNTYETFVVNHITNANAGGGETPPTACFVSLWVGDPTDTGAGGAETTYGTYARQEITLSAASGRAVVQNGLLTYPTAADAGGTVTHWGIHTLVSGGTMMAHGALDTSRAIVSGNTPSVATTEVSVAISAGVFTTTFANTVLDWLFRNQTFTQPANLYVAMCKLELSDTYDMSTANTELDMTGYAREAIPKGTTYWNTVSGDPAGTANKLIIDFGTLTGGGPETVTAIGICASGTKETDDLYMWSNAADQAMADDDDLTIPAGDLTISAN